MSPSGVEINRNIPFGHFALGAALAQVGPRPELGFCSIRRAGTSSDNAIYLARHENLIEGMRKPGLPEE